MVAVQRSPVCPPVSKTNRCGPIADGTACSEPGQHCNEESGYCVDTQSICADKEGSDDYNYYKNLGEGIPICVPLRAHREAQRSRKGGRKGGRKYDYCSPGQSRKRLQTEARFNFPKMVPNIVIRDVFCIPAPCVPGAKVQHTSVIPAPCVPGAKVQHTFVNQNKEIQPPFHL